MCTFRQIRDIATRQWHWVSFYIGRKDFSEYRVIVSFFYKIYKCLRTFTWVCAYYDTFPFGNYMFKVNDRRIRTRCEIYSKLTIKKPEQSYCYLWTHFTPCSSVSIVNFEQINAGWVLTLQKLTLLKWMRYIFENKHFKPWLNYKCNRKTMWRLYFNLGEAFLLSDMASFGFIDSLWNLCYKSKALNFKRTSAWSNGHCKYVLRVMSVENFTSFQMFLKKKLIW